MTTAIIHEHNSCRLNNQKSLFLFYSNFIPHDILSCKIELKYELKKVNRYSIIQSYLYVNDNYPAKLNYLSRGHKFTTMMIQRCDLGTQYYT